MDCIKNVNISPPQKCLQAFFFIPACNESNISGIAKRSVIWNVEENEEKAEGLS